MSMRVYISSATREMRDYREAAIRAIRDSGMEPVYLNDGFPPSPDPTLTLLDLNERYVKGCDVFVGLYGYQGTWQPADNDPKLISEWEHEWARKANLPCFCYIPGGLEPASLDQTTSHSQMELFKQKIARTYPVVWLHNPEVVYQQLREQLEALKDSVFLSYSSKDRDFAVWLKNEFRKDNIAVWRDGDRIEPGSDWMSQLTRAIESCRLMVLLLSPDSVESKYVALELGEFQTANKRVFPVKVRNCDIPESISRLQVVDATDNKESAYFRLKRAIENALEKTA